MGALSSEGIAGFSLVFVSVEISHNCTVGFKHHLRRASSRVTSSFVNNQLPSSMSGSNESELDLAWTKGLFHHTYLNYGASACQGWTLSRQALLLMTCRLSKRVSNTAIPSSSSWCDIGGQYLRPLRWLPHRVSICRHEGCVHFPNPREWLGSTFPSPPYCEERSEDVWSIGPAAICKSHQTGSLVEGLFIAQLGIFLLTFLWQTFCLTDSSGKKLDLILPSWRFPFHDILRDILDQLWWLILIRTCSPAARSWRINSTDRKSGLGICNTKKGPCIWAQAARFHHALASRKTRQRCRFCNIYIYTYLYIYINLYRYILIHTCIIQNINLSSGIWILGPGTLRKTQQGVCRS